MPPPPTIAERSMAVGLRALNRVASSDALDRFGLRDPAVRLVRGVSRNGARTAVTAGRTFAAGRAGLRLSRPARQPRAPRSDLFDLQPSAEQEMLRDSTRDFAIARLRPAAEAADAACATSPALLGQANALGLTMVGVPAELGGAVEERSATTTVLMSEALARGDMGIAVACLAPAAVSTAISLWGDAQQQATFLPAFVGEDVPSAALAVMEPQPLFDPFDLQTSARPTGGGYTLSGVKALVPRAADAELFVIAADLAGQGPSLFIVESKTPGVAIDPEPAMGIRAAATGRLILDDVQLPETALLGGGQADVYAECVALGRLSWCALAVGTGQAALEYVSDYVKDRKAFGEPISHRQAVAFTVADMAIELDGLRLATLRAAGRVDQGLDCSREVALARWLCANRAMQLGSDAVQMLGGHGFVKEHPVERWYRDLRAAGLMEGALLV